MAAVIRATARSAASPDRLWALASDIEHWGDRLSTVDVVRALADAPILGLLVGRKARGMVETEAATFARLAEQG